MSCHTQNSQPTSATRRPASLIPCFNWPSAAQLAFSTGKAPIRLRGRWYVRGAA